MLIKKCQRLKVKEILFANNLSNSILIIENGLYTVRFDNPLALYIVLNFNLLTIKKANV